MGKFEIKNGDGDLQEVVCFLSNQKWRAGFEMERGAQLVFARSHVFLNPIVYLSFSLLWFLDTIIFLRRAVYQS